MSYNINLRLIKDIINNRADHNPYLTLEQSTGSYVDASIDEVKFTSFMSENKLHEVLSITITPLNIATTSKIEIMLMQKDFKDVTISNVKDLAFELMTVRGSIELVNELYRSDQYEKIRKKYYYISYSYCVLYYTYWYILYRVPLRATKSIGRSG
ncbi:hypothetical protein [Staphylococcus phage vB_SsapH-Golestan-100]|nr:hypothetical protein [Staphylococcus phage vB_SsapH-Golestan-100]